MTYKYKTNQPVMYDGKQYQAGYTIPITGMTSNGKEILFDNGALYFNPNYTSLSVGSSNFPVLMSDLKFDGDGHIYYISKVDGKKIYYLYRNEFNTSDFTPDPIGSPDEDHCASLIAQGYSYFTMDNLIGAKTAQPLWIQLGANSGQGVFIPLVDATAAGIGLETVNVLSSTDATNAIADIDDAITKVSEYRIHFGTQQNRLDHALLVDDNAAENLQSAESKIRDADMADEMTELSKYNILLQAEQAMLAQTNQSPQGIMNLLRV